MNVIYIVHQYAGTKADKTITTSDHRLVDALESQCCHGPVRTGEYPKLGITIVEVEVVP
jgi:hypothetical protein